MRHFLLATFLACLLSADAAAQLAGGADLAYRSTYVWRGLRRSDGPVVQPGAFLSWQPAGWTVTAGGWASVELTEADSSGLTDAGRAGGLAEIDYWVEGHTRRGRFDLRAGTIRYTFQGDPTRGGRGAAWNTGEIYGAAAVLLSGTRTIALNLAYDYDAIAGAYAALEALQYVPLAGVHDIMVSGLLRAELGASAGLTFGPDPDDLGYYADNGLTHIDLSMALRGHSERVAGFTSFHFQFNLDDATWSTGLTRRRPRQYWLDAGVSVLIGPRARELR